MGRKSPLEKKSERLESLLKEAETAARTMQWVDLPLRVFRQQDVEVCLEQFNAENARVLALIGDATNLMEREAKNVLRALSDLQNKLAQVPDTACHSEASFRVHTSAILSHLYERVEEPLCLLVQDAPVAKIIMKRRAFSYELFSLRARLVSPGGDSFCLNCPVTFQLRIFTSRIPTTEVLETKRGDAHSGARMLMGQTTVTVQGQTHVVFSGVSFAEVTRYLPSGTVSLVVCAPSAPQIEPLIIPGVRVRSISKKLTF